MPSDDSPSSSGAFKHALSPSSATLRTWGDAFAGSLTGDVRTGSSFLNRGLNAGDAGELIGEGAAAGQAGQLSC